MNRVLILILGFAFLVSVGVNFYLYTEVQRYEEAWVEQLITTSEIEGILKASKADTTFEGMQLLAIAKFGMDSVSEAEVPDIHI